MRNYIASSLVIFFFVRSSLSVISVAPFVNVDIKEKSCCSLEWVAQESRSMSYAISINTTDGDVYLAKREDGSYDFLEKNGTQSYRNRRQNDRYSLILSNPQNCSLIWVDRLTNLTALRASELLIPTIDGKSISLSYQERRSKQYYEDKSQSKLIAEYFDLYHSQTTKSADLCGREESNSICRITNRSMLHIDCIASMKSNLVVKLDSIDFNSSLISKNSLASNYSLQDIANNSNETIPGLYYSQANFPISLSAKNFYGRYGDGDESHERFLDAFEDDTDLGRFLDTWMPSEIKSVWKSALFRRKFGQIHRRYSPSANTDVSEVTLKEAIKVTPLTKCHYATSIETFIIDSPVNVTLAIVPRTEFWKHEDILRSFRVLNISTDKLRLSDYTQELKFWYSGSINIGGYYDAKLTHECEKITPDE